MTSIQQDAFEFKAFLDALPTTAQRVSVRRTEVDSMANGSYALVFKGELLDEDSKASSVVAIKVLSAHSAKDGMEALCRRLKREISIWSSIPEHDNVLPLKGICPVSEKSTVWLVMPLMSRGNIRSFLRSTEGQSAKRISLITDVACGLLHLHQHGIIHGDLKGDNILISDQSRAQLCDFGLSSLLEDEYRTEISKSMKEGSYRWMAPERLDPQSYGTTPAGARTEASDIFSLGMSIYEIIAGRIPFSEIGDIQASRLILGGTRPAHPGVRAVRRGLNPMLWHFTELCWENTAERRPNIGVLFDIVKDGDSSIMTIPISPRVNPAHSLRQRASPEFQRLIDSSPVPILDTPSLVKICAGHSAQIYQGELPEDMDSVGAVIAVKVVLNLSNTPGLSERVMARIHETAHLSHENVLPLLGISVDWIRAKFSLVYDFVERRDLETFLKRGENCNYIQMAEGIAKGIAYLHGQGIVHGDLNPANILITTEKIPVLSCISYRLCLEREVGLESSASRYMELRWLPPEVVLQKEVASMTDLRKESDIYTFGMVLYRLLYNERPFYEEANPFNILTRLTGNQHIKLDPDGIATSRGMTPTIRQFLARSWAKDPLERPTIDDFSVSA